jgi:hypothetical protein
MTTRSAPTPDQLQWVVVHNPKLLRQPPEWARTAAIDHRGTVYAPAALAGPEDRVVLMAAWDGSPCLILDQGHAYLPTSTLTAIDPENQPTYSKIERDIRAHFHSQL